MYDISRLQQYLKQRLTKYKYGKQNCVLKYGRLMFWYNSTIKVFQLLCLTLLRPSDAFMRQ